MDVEAKEDLRASCGCLEVDWSARLAEDQAMTVEIDLHRSFAPSGGNSQASQYRALSGCDR